jgi:hypothetical protein
LPQAQHKATLPTRKPFANTWKMLPQELEEESVVENYLETLVDEENKEKLKNLIARLQDLLQE